MGEEEEGVVRMGGRRVGRGVGRMVVRVGMGMGMEGMRGGRRRGGVVLFVDFVDVGGVERGWMS